MSDALDSQLSTFLLADYFSQRQAAILSTWHLTCENDPALPTGASLTKEEFYDHIPELLNALGHRLRRQPDAVAVTAQRGRDHGRHRWHKGYPLGEILGEFAHLHNTLVGELRTFQDAHPTLDSDDLLVVHNLLNHLIHESIGESVSQYSLLQKLEAASRGEELQQALDQLRQLDRQRGDFLRMASHDLYSSFGAIQGAAFILDQPEISNEERTEMLQMLQRNFPKITALLTRLMDLARLEAGQESLRIETFDGAAVLRDLLESLQPLADERGLFLHGEGPPELPMESDPVKVYRVAQNLVLNALKYTETGGVSIRWAAENTTFWTMSVQDSGPGLSPRSAAWVVDPDEEPSVPFRVVSTETTYHSSEGEGIGLYIVKRLCALLNASMRVETRRGVGTLFQIRLPRRYEKGGA